MVVLIMIIMLVIGRSGIDGGIPKSTANRTKVQTGVAFQNDCVIDELGWVDDEAKTEKSLQKFYNETGVQPFVYLRDYDPDLKTDDEKISFAENWYEDNIDNEGTFLVVYFAEEDTDNDVGYMAHVNGKEITSVMDSEAIDIFWAYWDSYWASDRSTDAVITEAFTDTGNRIMDRSTTGMDVLKWVVIGIVIVVIIVLFIVFVRMKFRREKERADETERILKAPLHSSDSILDKYGDKEE